jgi:hypothetical protein
MGGFLRAIAPFLQIFISSHLQEGRNVAKVEFLPILSADMKSMYRNLAPVPEAAERRSGVFTRKFNGFR